MDQRFGCFLPLQSHGTPARISGGKSIFFPYLRKIKHLVQVAELLLNNPHLKYEPVLFYVVLILHT